MDTSTNDIKKHWDTVARAEQPINKGGVGFGTTYLDYCGTLKDHNLFNLEVTALLKYLKGGEYICDVGCGRGYTPLYLAWKHKLTVLGIDYSDEMIAVAHENLWKVQPLLQGTVHFQAGDALDSQLIQKFPAPFDVVITQRCLVNLPTWEQQQEAICNISRMLKRDGLFLMLEGSKQGLAKLNQVRTQYRLSEIPVVWHNLFFDDDTLDTYASRYFEHIATDNFCSTYMLISRVLHPALIFPVEPEYDAGINKTAVNIPNLGDFGYSKLYVFRKRY